MTQSWVARYTWRGKRPLASCLLPLAFIACKADRPALASDAATGTAPGTSAGPAAARADPVFGRWTVTGYKVPGISAMSNDEAGKWRGKVIELSANSAATGPESCSTPTYETITVPADSMLGLDYRVSGTALGLTPGATIDVTRVSCSGSPWAAPGGVLLHTAPNKAFTVWDGVFFELERS